MSTWIALLRGINVGGRARVPMAEFRALLTDLGYGDVRTHLQSGNAVFTADETAPDVLCSQIEDAVEDAFGLTITVVLRTPDELAAVVTGNPFPDATAEPAKLHVAFLSEPLDRAKLAGMDAAAYSPDVFQARDREIYAWYPDGMGRSKLTNDVFERRLGVRSTMRNWNTVTKLRSLAQAS